MKRVITICEDVLTCNDKINKNDWEIVLNELSKVYDLEIIAFEDMKNLKTKYNYIKNTYPQFSIITLQPTENKYGLFFKRTPRDYYMTISNEISILVMLESQYKISYGITKCDTSMYLKAYSPYKCLDYIRIIEYNEIAS